MSAMISDVKGCGFAEAADSGASGEGKLEQF
jgi:hypothetical protein